MNLMNRTITALVLALLVLANPLFAQNATNTIEAINVAQQGVEVAIKIDLKEALSVPPTGFSVATPAKIAFDFASTANGLGKNSQIINQGDLHGYNVVQAGERTRLVLNLVRNMNFTTRLDGKSLYVILSPIVSGEGSAAQRVTRFADENLVGKRHAIQDVVFRRGKDGEARIIVDLSDPGAGIDIRQQGASLIVDFMKTSVPEHLRRKLDVNDFATPVTGVETREQGENVRMIISPRGLWEHNAYQSENQFVVEVKKIIEDPNKLVQGSKIGYQGPKISIRYQGFDLQALLKLLAEELKLNAVFGENVKGAVTLNLMDVPVDQAMDVIFKMHDLDMRKNGNIILIDKRSDLAAREKLEYDALQQIGELEPLRTEAFQINYQKADALQKLLTDSSQRMLSKRGSAVVDPRTNTIFIQDTSSRLDDVRNVIARVDVPVRQVMIEARIVEARDTFAKNLGARLGFLNRAYRTGSQNQVAVGANNADTLGSIGAVGSAATSPLTQMVNLPAAPINGTSAGALSFVLYNAASLDFLSLEISALEADGRGKVISSPRVMTADQIEALIEQGTEIPYLQATSSGATSIAFRKAMLALKVKPQITPDGKITLTLDVNKDFPTILSTGAVAIDTKHVKTEVLVDNGGTVVIGGIFTQDTSSSTQKIPLLGDVPYLGFLFRSTQKQDNKTELLIFITPKIISEKLGLN